MTASQPASYNRRIGRWGEDRAADHLVTHGYTLLDANIRTPYGEIDLAAQQGDVTVFVEVKTRTSGAMGLPEVSINARKRDHMLAAAGHYAAEHHIDHWRIDVISVQGKPGRQPVITHFENAIS